MKLKNILNKKSAILVVASAIMGASVLIAYNKTEDHISSTEFCTGCHSMQLVYQELVKSPHYQGRVGIDPECGDCHLPSNPISRSIEHIVTGAEDMFKEYILGGFETKEKFNKSRPRLAQEARIKLYEWNSSPCKMCHKSPGREGKLKKYHDILREEQRDNCIDCHKNLVHAPVPKIKLE